MIRITVMTSAPCRSRACLHICSGGRAHRERGCVCVTDHALAFKSIRVGPCTPPTRAGRALVCDAGQACELEPPVLMLSTPLFCVLLNEACWG